MKSNNQETQYLPFSFEGSGKEYFHIWIVNIALTILTLGIYSAWAKVRTNRYFYANTYLNGSNFEYNAEPKKILIGRAIVFGAYIVFTIFFDYLGMREIAIGLILLGFLAMPWLIRQAVSFKIRNTSYRNVPFRYTGTTWQFYKFFIFHIFLFLLVIALNFVVPIIPMILIFLLTGYTYVNFKDLTISHSHYGDGDFYFSGKSGEIYKIYLKIMGWMILLGIAIVIGTALLNAIFGTQEIMKIAESSKEISSMDKLIVIVGSFSIYIPVLFFQKGLSDGYHSNFVRNNTTLNGANLKSIMSPLKLGWLSLTNILALIFSLGLLYPWTKVRYIRYKLEHTYFRCEDYEQFKSQGYVHGSTIGEESVDFFDMDIGL
jgi:uncharacterized membrane protein YjgN (DUF898 family)